LSSDLSNLVKILPRTPPPAPRRLQLAAGAGGVDLDWQADDPAVGFRVYRRDAASRTYGQPIAEPKPTARAHRDATARFDSRYVYSITAVRLTEPRLESALAGELEISYQDRYPPEPPTGVIVLAEPGRTRLLWEPSAAGDVAGYLVYREDEEGTGFARLSEQPGLELGYLDDTVTSGRGYRYYVSAVDRNGNESEASETVAATIP
jgi:fibronectin type 3 domain-containing protein